MRYLFVRLILLVLLSIGASGIEADDANKVIGPLHKRNLKTHFQLDKTSYLTAEPIFVTLWIENFGRKTEYYARNEFLEIRLSTEQGTLIKMRAKIQEESMFKGEFILGVGNGDWKAIRPGMVTQKAQFYLYSYYGSGQADFDCYLPPGRYFVSALRMRSDSVLFDVHNPTDSLDLAAMSLLTHAADSAYYALGKYSQSFKFFSEFVAQFPNSVFTPRALGRLLDIPTNELPNYPESKRQEYVRLMIDRFSISGFVSQAIYLLKPDMINQSEREGVIEGLKKAKPRLLSDDMIKRTDDLIGELEK